MIDALKFIQGALKSNTIVPELEYYQIVGGRVTGYNGYMALSSPIDLDIEAKPKAALFHKALQACGDTVTIDKTPGGRLTIRSGAFRAYIPCTEAEIYEATPQGDVYPAPEGLVAWCKKLLPIISQDASRPWAMGMNIHSGKLEVTNNVTIVQGWLGHQLPTLNCPRFAVAELARIGVDPVRIQVCPASITFHYENGRWLRTQVLSSEWPTELVRDIFSRVAGATPQPIPPGLFEGLKKIAPFVPAETTRVKFKEGMLETGDGEAGAAIKVEGLQEGPIFSSRVLELLEGLMETADFSTYPDPCPFYGPSLRGVVIGMRS